MPTVAPSGDHHPEFPGSEAPLRKAIRRTLAGRNHNVDRLRENVRDQVAVWRLEGISEETILPSLLAIASDVAASTKRLRAKPMNSDARWLVIADTIRVVAEADGAG
jgi:hypothetical protein